MDDVAKKLDEIETKLMGLQAQLNFTAGSLQSIVDRLKDLEVLCNKLKALHTDIIHHSV